MLMMEMTQFYSDTQLQALIAKLNRPIGEMRLVFRGTEMCVRRSFGDVRIKSEMRWTVID
jgi:hypothetical protein